MNAGFLVGHSALRRVGHGRRRRRVPAPPTTRSRPWWPCCTARSRRGRSGSPPPRPTTHNDGDGMPVPSRGRVARRARGAVRGAVGASGHDARAHRARVPERVQRRRGRPHGDAVAPGRPARQLERPRRVGAQPRRPRAPAGGVDRGGRARAPRWWRSRCPTP